MRSITLWKEHQSDGHSYRMVKGEERFFIEAAPTQIDGTPDEFEGVVTLLDWNELQAERGDCQHCTIALAQEIATLLGLDYDCVVDALK